MSFHTLDEQPPYMVPLRRARFATPENPANSPPFRLHAGDTLSMAETDEATVSTITNVINNIVPTAVNNDAGSNSVTPVGDPFTPGDAVTPGGSAAYTSRSRGGTASLIGFSEYGTASTPAKKYLVQTYTSDRARCSRNTNCAGSIQGSDSFIGNEVCTYNVTTGALTSTGSTVNRQTFGSCPATSITSTVAAICSRTGLDAGYSGAFWNYTTQTQTSLITAAGSCGINESGYYSTPSGGQTLTLTSEDTDATAITRLLATSPSWSSWTSATLPGAACSHTARTTGFSFTYGEAELKVNVTGFPAAFVFTLRAQIVRIDTATSELSLVATQDYLTTADGAGAATVTIGVEADEAGPNGYTYKVNHVEWFHAP